MAVFSAVLTVFIAALLDLVKTSTDASNCSVYVTLNNVLSIIWFAPTLPQICRANHCCLPNCNYYWNDELGQQHLYVARKVRGADTTLQTTIKELRIWLLNISGG